MMSVLFRILCFGLTGLFLCNDARGGEQPRASHGMVVAAESLAAEAGLHILKRGGNAVDAAVALGFALAVTYPEAGNIGGGGFMLIRLAGGRTTVIDCRESAPGLATRHMYLDRDGNPVAHRSLYGPLAAGVPGTVAGFLHALEFYGTMSRREVLEDALRLAENGFRVDERLALSFKNSIQEFAGFSSTKKAFTQNGAARRVGDWFVQPDLGRTLRAIEARGTDGFYKGWVADRIVGEMKRGGGIMTHADLARYRAVEREPVVGSYRGYTIVSAPLPSAGGVVLVQMLNMLEPFDLSSKGVLSAETIHLIAGAAQRSYADRAEYLGDPDVVSVPVAPLLSKSYAADRMRNFDTVRAMTSVQIRPGSPPKLEQQHTTHYCVADQYGNVVSTTVTLNGYYGCKTVVDGAGFFLNNEMDDFVVKAGTPNMFGLVGGDANAIAPGKRMLSSMTPTIVLKDGAPYLLAGARGGSRIPTALLQIILNVVDFGMNIRDAVNAPRVHHQWLPDKLFRESSALSPNVKVRLQGMGYALEESPEGNGRAQAMLIENGWFYGGPDLREQGVAIGY